MAVKVQRDAYLAVPEPFTGDLGVNAIGKHVSGVRMSQIMEPQARKPRLFDRPRP